MWGRIASQVGQLAGDFPRHAGGRLGGAVKGELRFGTTRWRSSRLDHPRARGPWWGAAWERRPGRCWAAAMAPWRSPAAIRRVLIDSYTKGSIQDAQDFLGPHGGHVLGCSPCRSRRRRHHGCGQHRGCGCSPGHEARSPPRTAQMASEVTTMVTAGKAMQGQLPNAQDFLDAAVVVGGMHLATMGVDTIKGQSPAPSRKKLGNTYAATGIRPDEVARTPKPIPPFRQDIASDNIDIPRQYEGSVDPAGLTPEMGPRRKSPPMSRTRCARRHRRPRPSQMPCRAMWRIKGVSIEQRFANQLTDYAAAKERYAALPESRGGKVINTDIARETPRQTMPPAWNPAALWRPMCTEPASAFVKKALCREASRASWARRGKRGSLHCGRHGRW